MKDKLIVILAVVLVVALAAQAYTLFQLSGRVDQLSPQGNKVSAMDTPLIRIPPIPKLKTPKWGLDDKFYKDDEWNPYEEMQRMQHEMEEMFSDSFSRFHLKTPLGSLNKTPDVDLEEKPDRFIVTVNVPGADESSLDVRLENQQLHISIKTAHAEDQADEKKGQYKYRERFIGEFNRVLTLPGVADATKMKTNLHNGVLTIIIPKE